MAINLESAKAGVAGPAVSADRRQAGARQDRWMLELEKAFTGTDKQNNAGGQASDTARTDAGRRFASPSAASLVQRGASAHGLAQMAAAPASSRVSQHGDAQVPDRPTRRQAAAANEKSSSHHRVKDMAQMQDAAKPGAMRADEFAAQTLHPVVASQLASPGAALIQPAVLSAAVGEGAQPATLAAASGSSVRLSFSAAALGGQGAPAAAQFAAVDEPQASGGANGKNVDGKPWDKRAMHVFVDSQGVHAFIRDAALQAGQLRGMVQALSSEMAASGKSLAALTVNGKVVDPRAAASQLEEDDMYTQHEERGDHPTSRNYSTQSAFKGNP